MRLRNVSILFQTKYDEDKTRDLLEKVKGKTAIKI